MVISRKFFRTICSKILFAFRQFWIEYVGKVIVNRLHGVYSNVIKLCNYIGRHMGRINNMLLNSL